MLSESTCRPSCRDGATEMKSFSGCFGKAGKICCVYLALQPALQVLAGWLYQEREKQCGRVRIVALPGPCLLQKEVLQPAVQPCLAPDVMWLGLHIS